MDLIKIENNVIQIVSGDTAYIKLNVENYELSYGDIIYFTVKNKMTDNNNLFQVKVTEFDEDGCAMIHLTKDKTSLQKGRYFYDIQLNTKDGEVDTIVMPNVFFVLGGVTNE